MSTEFQMKPRPYQLSLLEYVMERNAIIFLPTGAGKTFIAILALKRFSHEMVRPISDGGKRAVYMCNTVELARQQQIQMKKNTNLKIGLYIGERGVDHWQRKKWDSEIQENQVLVGTAQIFVDLVSQNYIKVTDLSVVIIDECHHATKNHPMNEFMRLFQYAEQDKLPRVIGLTGVLLKGNKLNEIEKELTALEAKYRGNIITVGNQTEYENVMLFSTKPTEEFITYKNDKYICGIEYDIKQMLNECFIVVDSWELGTNQVKLSKGLESVRDPSKKHFIKNLLKDFIYQMDDFGIYLASFAIMSPIIEFEIRKRQSDTLALRNLYRYVITVCERIRHIIVKKLKDLVDDNNAPDSECHKRSIIINFATPKLRAFLCYMEKKFTGKQKNDISCLVFVERRYSAKALYFVLQKFTDDTPALKGVIYPQFMVGRNAIAPNIENILDRKWNKSAIDQFRKKQCNVIVCSNVLEEGIDVQACNYVYVLDPLKTFNSYIQTKGRARSNESLYAIFTSLSQREKTLHQIGTYNEIHIDIKKFLIDRVVDREDPDDEQIAEQFIENIPPFVIPSGAFLLASNALQLLHRYCQMLPVDAFGAVLPWFQKQLGDGVKVALKLPLQSNVKETIISDRMENVKMAKIDAAYKACIKLYEHGELNEQLLPISKQECVANVAEVHFVHWKKYDDNVTSKRLGRQKRRIYKCLSPDEFFAATPVVGKICYAYKISIYPLFEKNSYNDHIYRALHEPTCYAILLNKRLPHLAEMPLFMNQGRINVKIWEEPLEFIIPTEEDLEFLIKYQYMLYKDILNVWKHFLVLDRRNKENSYLIVPLKNDNIDWALIQTFQRLPPFYKPTIAERQNKVHRPEDYLGKVVDKWYTGLNERFIVVAVHTNMSPQSQFSDDKYENYEQFMTTKYGDEINQIYHKQQFLIEVRQFAKRRNFFVNSIGKAGKLFRNRGTIMLIPETVHNFMYPGDMWLKALLLPSILHRVNYMLHAESIRKRINAFLKIEDNVYKPKQLAIDQSLRRTVDTEGNPIKELEVIRKVLPPLPAKTVESHTETEAVLLNDEGSQWKEYMEPQDISRHLDEMYEVEIAYYNDFIQGKITTIVETEEELYLNSHLLKAEMKPLQDDNSKKPSSQLLAIADAEKEDKRYMNILEVTLNPDKIKTGEQFEFLAALTTASASDIFDMERFELLGDSFLKLAISLYLANKYPQWHEGFLSMVKSKIVSNRNLLYCMLDMDISQRVYSSLFQPQMDWLPPHTSLPENILKYLDNHLKDNESLEPRVLYGLHLTEDDIISGTCSQSKFEKFTQNFIESKTDSYRIEADTDNELSNYINRDVMADKVVADTLEAILGVCVKNYGIHNGFRLLEYFGIIKPEKGECLSNLLDLNLRSSLLRANASAAHVDGFLINREEIEANLGYKFQDRAYLLQALTHPSYPTNRITGCYQELEFIGDSILDFLVSAFIYERNQKMTPGMLTDLRSALVNNITLGCICVRHRFHLYLLAENAALSEAIKNFADFQKTQGYRVTNQVRILMEEDEWLNADAYDRKYNMSVNIDVPKALGDVVEAIIAAVYLDCRNLRTTWDVIYHLLEIELNEFPSHVPIDPVRQLFEHKYADPHFGDPVLDKLQGDAIYVTCHFTCLQKQIEVTGFGSNSKQAKKSAAKHALQILAKATPD